MAARSSLRKEQAAALQRMLDLNRGEGGDSWHDPWKILVYDAYCRDIISPLLKVGDLRKCGITLHLLLEAEREQVGDVPAIYFMQPTRGNVKRLSDDCARALYESFHVNFTPAVPRPLLEELAHSVLESSSVAQVSRVTDQYLNFGSVEEDFFSLLLPTAYTKLNDPASADTTIGATVDEIVAGLFSVVVTQGAVPILRYATGGAAQMVAERLGRRLHDELKAHPALFADGASSGFQRPLLVLVERSLDFSAMVQHAWTYCALCHDVLNLKLNRVTIEEPAAEGGAVQKRTHDLHAGDAFWAEHLGAGFQDVASDVDRELTEYRAAMEAINTGGRAAASAPGDAAIADTTRALTDTINALPVLQEKKRLIDSHMNIATELLRHIKARGLDSYYALEESLMEGRPLSKEDKATLPTLLDGEASGTADDRLRLLLLLVLHKGSVPAEEVDAFEAALREAGADLRPLAYLRRSLATARIEASSARQAAEAPAPATTGGRLLSAGLRLADQVGVGGTARGLGSALAAGVKQLLPSRRETPLTSAVKTLMDGGAKDGDDGFAYLDPKLGPAPSADGAAAARGRSAFGAATVFVVGPGNYLEYQSMRQSAAAAAPAAAGGPRRVVYGCTEVLTAGNFMQQISELA